VCFGPARLVLVTVESGGEVGIDKWDPLIPTEEYHVSFAETLIKIIKSKKRKNSCALSDINYDDDNGDEHDDDEDREGDDEETDDGREFSESKVASDALGGIDAISWERAIDQSDPNNYDDDYQFTFDSPELKHQRFVVLQKSMASGEQKHSPLEMPYSARTDENTSSLHSAIGISLTRKQTSESESTDISLNYSHLNSHLNQRRTTHESSDTDYVTVRLYAVAFKLELVLLRGYVSLPITKINRNNVSSARHVLSVDEAHSRARSCTSNADIACHLSPGDVGLGQYWRLLAVVLEMLTITDSGALIDWSSSLGGSLLLRLYLHMKEARDVQTYAITIFTFGGADVLIELLLDTCNDGPSKHLDRQQLEIEMSYVLYYYSDVLHRWGEHMHAVEVRLNYYS